MNFRHVNLIIMIFLTKMALCVSDFSYSYGSGDEVHVSIKIQSVGENVFIYNYNTFQKLN